MVFFQFFYIENLEKFWPKKLTQLVKYIVEKLKFPKLSKFLCIKIARFRHLRIFTDAFKQQKTLRILDYPVQESALYNNNKHPSNNVICKGSGTLGFNQIDDHSENARRDGK
jgi:hypothetical protein